MITLIGDISATNTSLAHIDNSHGIKKVEHFKTNEIENFEKFLEIYSSKNMFIPHRIILSCAGEVKNQKVNLTNVDLTIDSEKIKKYFQIDSVKIVNDMESIFLGINCLDKSQKLILKEINQEKNSLLIAPGTGLGILSEMNSKIESYENGHDIANDILEEKLISFLQMLLHKEEIEFEDVLSGRGIERIHLYLNDENKKANEISLANNLKSQNTFEMFFKNLALAINYFSNKKNITQVYIAGGIVPKNLDYLNQKEFLKQLNENLNIEFILDYNVSLFGLKEISNTKF